MSILDSRPVRRVKQTSSSGRFKFTIQDPASYLHVLEPVYPKNMANAK